MKPDKKNVQEILDRALTRHGNLSRSDVESAMDSAWERLKPDMESASEWRVAPMRPSRRMFAVGFAAAAAIVFIAFVSFVMTSNVVDVGEVVRSENHNKVVFLSDGSKVEMHPQTQFSLERADDGLRIHLAKGSVIVNAAEQRAGHLYVQTKDVTVSVVGTVFFVNAEEEGSRVAVIEGEVRVQQGSTTTNLVQGEQFATISAIPSRPVVEEVAWSQRAETHVAALQQATTPPVPAVKPLVFEAASIRQISSDDALSFLMPMSAPGSFFGDEDEVRCRAVDGTWSSKDDRQEWANGSNIPLGRCLGSMSLTYFARMVRDMDHPAATKSDYTRIPKGLGRGPDGSPIHYLLNAKADDPSKVTKAELRQMLKNVAFHRLKLQYHMETTIVDGWAVRIAPGGLKIKEVSQDAPGKSIQVFFSGMAPRNGQLISYGPVIDMTGLTGKVFEITWNPKIIPSPSAGARGGTVGGANVPFPDYNPPLEKQLEEQLGLTITKEKVPVQVLVVDHLEEPSEN